LRAFLFNIRKMQYNLRQNAQGASKWRPLFS
jgi:hypothetical protein